jgi:prepilin-type N-terminal cleavage/methylation domain-containing protein
MRSTRAGFSLIELVVVLTLIAVMAMTVTPVFQASLGSARADHAARDLFAELISARERAVTHAVEYRVYFDERENRYWAAYGPFTAKGEMNTATKIDGEIVTVPDRLRITDVRGRRGGASGTYYLAFYPHGACDVGYVTLTDERDRSRVYRLELTGSGVQMHTPE